MPKILEPRTSYIVDYPQAVDFARKQMAVFWTPEEIRVEDDVQDVLVELTEAERHGVTTTLKLFTMYELIIGGEFWQDMVFNWIKRPADIQRMAKTFSFIELGVHGPFYNKINEALGLATDEFYHSYLDDPVLRDRIEFLNKAAGQGGAKGLVALSLAEGAILYSNFAFLKHFKSAGKNKINNIVRGINFSVRDENLHAEASAWLYREITKDYPEMLQPEEWVHQLALTVYEHEKAIIRKIFEKGRIDGITDVQLTHFVESRINLILANLGYAPMFTVTYNPVAEWFYAGINNYVMNDFFAGQGREYVRTWDDSEFTW